MQLLTEEKDCIKFKFPSIRHFRDVVKEYNKVGIRRSVKCIGRPKIHGMNGSILFTENGFSVHTKETQVFGPGQSEGFYEWAVANVKTLDNYRARVLKAMPEVAYPFVVSGEWAGGNVQRKASTNGVEKFFCVFQVGNVREEEDNGVVGNHVQFMGLPNPFLTDEDNRLFDIRQFGQWTAFVDFARPEDAINLLADFTIAAEKDCPVSRALGKVSDQGEGIVWSCTESNDRHLFFKVKGKKHSSSKVRELVQVTPEQIESLVALVDYVCTENRMEQAFKEVQAKSKEDVGAFLRWVHLDIRKEEADTIAANGLEYKDLSARVGTKALDWFNSKF